MAAIYHFKFCRAILVGFRRQLKADGVCRDGYVGMLDAGQEKTEVPCYHVGYAGQVFEVEIDGSPIYRDDLTGQPLDPKLVREARQKELDFFEAKKVWQKRAFEEARRRTGKPPITVRWVDVNKEDDKEPNVRSRLVAKEIAFRRSDDFFAATPPLEVLKLIVSMPATENN